MAGNSPEREKTLRVTVGRLVKIEKSKEQGEYVALKFELLEENEDDARQLFDAYLSAIQVGNDSSAREIGTKFFTLTHFSAADINAKRQERWGQLAKKVRGIS